MQVIKSSNQQSRRFPNAKNESLYSPQPFLRFEMIPSGIRAKATHPHDQNPRPSSRNGGVCRTIVITSLFPNKPRTFHLHYLDFSSSSFRWAQTLLSIVSVPFIACCLHSKLEWCLLQGPLMWFPMEYNRSSSLPLSWLPQNEEFDCCPWSLFPIRLRFLNCQFDYNMQNCGGLLCLHDKGIDYNINAPPLIYGRT